MGCQSCMVDKWLDVNGAYCTLYSQFDKNCNTHLKDLNCAILQQNASFI